MVDDFARQNQFKTPKVVACGVGKQIPRGSFSSSQMVLESLSSN
jgi:hypothetical protein